MEECGDALVSLLSIREDAHHRRGAGARVGGRELYRVVAQPACHNPRQSGGGHPAPNGGGSKGQRGEQQRVEKRKECAHH